MLVRATNDELHFCGFGESVPEILWPVSNVDFNYRQLAGLHNSHKIQGQ